jgi:hypothetical protein
MISDSSANDINSSNQSLLLNYNPLHKNYNDSEEEAI